MLFSRCLNASANTHSSKNNPVGGASRFVTLVKEYRNGAKYAGQPKLLTFFSGDAFNPSIESSVTRGKHMPPVLNAIGTDVAALGNHDLDFGVDTFVALQKKCRFPWLNANIHDPALGEGVGIGGLKGTHMLESNGIKVGVIAVGEKEWLETINLLPPDLKFIEPSVRVKELAPGLRKAGAEIIVVVSHMREPNDVRLAEEIPEGLVDVILGGHDHHYAHQIINGVHILRSGCDFKQLSYLELYRKDSKWLVNIWRRDITTDITPDPDTVKLVDKLTEGPKAKLETPIGRTKVPLDARFSVVRCKESNLGNFVCDLMRYYYSSDCAIMPAGTIRGDQIYPPGTVTLGDLVNCFPFEDPVVVMKVKGKNLWDALENGVSKLPALEGRFPQVSNIIFKFDATREPGSRILSVKVGDKDLDFERVYQVTTRGYVSRGKDGYESMTEDAGGKYVVDEENGVLIAMILRQYFLSLKVLGKWKGIGCFKSFFGKLKRQQSILGELKVNDPDDVFTAADEHSDSSDDEDETDDELFNELTEEERSLVARFAGKWHRKAKGMKAGEGDDWTREIAPKSEGRIVQIGEVEPVGSGAS